MECDIGTMDNADWPLIAMNKLVGIVLNCLHPVKTYRIILELQKTISELQESRKSLETDLSNKCLRSSENEAQLLNRISQLEIKLAETVRNDSDNEKELRLTLNESLRREDSLKSNIQGLESDVSRLKEELRLKCPEIVVRLQESEDSCKALNSRVVRLTSELETAKEEAIQFRQQVTGLKEWIRHVHRLDSIPVSNTMKDILQKAQV